MKRAIPALAALLTCTSAAAQSPAPERNVQGNVITSAHDPMVRIELPEEVRYMGADRWVLYDVADCEVHVFVEADAQKNVQRFYWIQFEGYIPAKPDSHYNYTDPVRTVAGTEFFVRARFGPTAGPVTAGSDLEHVQRLIRERGYKIPPDMMNVRLVHMLDGQKRKELMVIYAEDLAPTSLTSADLAPGAKGADQWPALEKGLIDRAEKNVALRFETGGNP